jgi:hypothetical protein
MDSLSKTVKGTVVGSRILYTHFSVRPVDPAAGIDQISAFIDRFHLLCQFVRIPVIVSIQEGKQVSRSSLHPAVSRRRYASISLIEVMDLLSHERFHNLPRAVSATVIDNPYFLWREGLPKGAFQCPADRLFTVEYGNYYANAHIPPLFG